MYFDDASLTTSVPEPSSLALLGMGLGLPFYSWRRRNSQLAHSLTKRPLDMAGRLLFFENEFPKSNYLGGVSWSVKSGGWFCSHRDTMVCSRPPPPVEWRPPPAQQERRVARGRNGTGGRKRAVGDDGHPNAARSWGKSSWPLILRKPLSAQSSTVALQRSTGLPLVSHRVTRLVCRR